MPTYEYRCKDCGEELEVVQSFSDDPLTECPSCQGQLKKVFGNVGIVLKGSGFYKTDTRPAGSKSDSRGSSDSASKNGESKSGDSKSSESSSSDAKSSSTKSTADSKPASGSAAAAAS